jgi:superfamily I DNA/RNA helicase
MAPAKVNVVIGPPGTGKTEQRVREIAELLQSGHSPSRMAYVTLGRQANLGAAKRAARASGHRASELTSIRNLHRVGYQLLKQELGKPPRLMVEPLPGPKGAAAALALLRARLPHATTWTEMRQSAQDAGWDSPEASWADIERYAEALARHKRENAVVDYTDLLHAKRTMPGTTLLMVDEAQDLNPLEVAAIRRWWGHNGTLEELRVSGDPDQAINGWSGGDAAWLTGLAKSHGYSVLNQSYRVPVLVHGLAKCVIGRCSSRLDATYYPRSENGMVRRIERLNAIPELVHKAQWDSAMVLCRNRRHFKSWANEFEAYGIPYVIEDDEMHNQPFKANTDQAKAIRSLERLMRGGKCTYDQYMSIVQFADPELNLPSPDQSEFLPVSLRYQNSVVSGKFIANVRARGHGVLSLIDSNSLNFYRRRFKFGREPVVITTIHASKGREADLVCVDSRNVRPDNAGFRIPDEEHRLAYVAVTRARQEVIIYAHGAKTDYPYII